LNHHHTQRSDLSASVENSDALGTAKPGKDQRLQHTRSHLKNWGGKEAQGFPAQLS
jgi:hypothetical protein